MNEERRRVVGVLLAAGRGRRMGTLKQLLPWTDSRTVVECAFDVIAPFCDAGVIVVLSDGAEGNRVADTLAPRQFTRTHGDSDSEMFDSIRAGLRAVDSRKATHFLLHPADHPTAPSEIVESIVQYPAGSFKAVIPTHNGTGGHPICVPTSFIDAISAWNGDGGLRQFWIEHSEQVVRVEYRDAPEIMLDLDHPEEYESKRPSP